MTSFTFNATEHKQMVEFEIIPAGWYAMFISDSEMKEPKSKPNSPEYLALTFQIDSGPKKGSPFYVNLNVNNESEIAQRIARSELATICTSCDRQGFNDTQEIHGIAIAVKVKVKVGSDQHGNARLENTVAMYKPLNKVTLPTNEEFAAAERDLAELTKNVNSNSSNEKSGGFGSTGGSFSNNSKPSGSFQNNQQSSQGFNSGGNGGNGGFSTSQQPWEQGGQQGQNQQNQGGFNQQNSNQNQGQQGGQQQNSQGGFQNQQNQSNQGFNQQGGQQNQGQQQQDSVPNWAMGGN